jgi:hypothetical protein
VPELKRLSALALLISEGSAIKSGRIIFLLLKDFRDRTPATIGPTRLRLGCALLCRAISDPAFLDGIAILVRRTSLFMRGL